MTIVKQLPVPVLVLMGAVGWTLAEYLMHRFAMHELRGRGLASREHLRHHADRDSILEKWPIAWAGVIVVAVFLLRPLGGWALAFGYVGGYGTYDMLHWRAHRRAPRNAYGRWVRMSHFHHHFHAPMRNFGVTSPFWDKVFGTYEAPTVVRLPQRMAMVWLVDDDGRLRDEFAGDYRVVGRRTLDDATRVEDRERAFANLVPSA
jgi:sterol desaturase/sphingolipid hydroxylase (fatty acid hydroxylase superfamily)